MRGDLSCLIAIRFNMSAEWRRMRSVWLGNTASG